MINSKLKVYDKMRYTIFYFEQSFSMDGCMTCDFTSFSTVLVISGRWADDNGRLCAVSYLIK